MSGIDHMLLYVSRKNIDPAIDELVNVEIVAVALSRNADLGVTGALVSTTDYFAQILEGPAAAIAELMDSIHHDSRHTDVTVLREAPIQRRRFADWSMAYAGPSTYVAGQIAPLIGANLEDVSPNRLISLMAGLAANQAES
jgi:hypothetical protein